MRKFEYSVTFITPVGIPVSLTLEIAFKVDFSFKIGMNSGIIILNPNVAASVETVAEVGVGLKYFSIGGYFQGTFLKTSLELFLTFNLLENVVFL